MMPINDPEFTAIQNEALGATILWTFCRHYADNDTAGNGPQLPLLMPVLPLIFNARATSSLFRRNLVGGLFKAVTEDRTLMLGLQDRMEKMSGQTFGAINLGIAAGILAYDSDSARIISINRFKPEGLSFGDANKMRYAAKRLGVWFATMQTSQVALLLRISFL